MLSTGGSCASLRPIPNGRTRPVSRTGRCAAAGLCEAFGWWAGARCARATWCAAVGGADETDGDPLCGASVAADEPDEDAAADEPDEDALAWLDAEVGAGCGAGELLAEMGCAWGAASGEALAAELAGAG